MNNNIDKLKTAAAYIRVSTDDQLELSPDSQLDEIKKFARQKGYLLLSDYIFIEKEGISGRKADKRPEFQRMISTAKLKDRPFDVIIVWKFSRFARNQDESTYYKSVLRKKCNVDIVSVSEPVLDGMYGRLIEMIIEWQDEFYSYNLATEVKRSMKRKAELGLYNSPPPFGYKRVGKESVIIPEEAAVIRTMYEDYASGSDINIITRKLNDMGLKTRRGNMYTSDTVKYILSNPFYIGKIRWNMRDSSATNKKKPREEWIITQSSHESIVDEDLYNKVQNRLEIRSLEHKKYQRGICHGTHWLSGLIKCSICGKGFYTKHERTTISFQCQGYKNGLHSESQNISEKKMVAAVIESLKSVASSEDIIEYKIIRSSPSGNNDIMIFKEELNKLQIKEERIKQAYINGIDTIEEYKTNKAMLDDQRVKLKKCISQMQSSCDIINTNDLFRKNVQYAIQLITDDTVESYKKAAALRSVVESITFFKKTKTIQVQYCLKI